MVKFKTLVFTFMIIMFSIITIPHTNSADSINELTILLKLVDGEPLSNAVVKVAPSSYYISNPSQVVENSTNENGLVKLYNVNVATYYNSYQFYLTIWYGFYGSIANMTLKVNQIQSVFIEITLPFKRLDISLNITDEYLNPVNGTYRLYHSTSNMLLIEGVFTNGFLELAKPVVKGYLLLQRSSDDIILSSNVGVQASNKLITYSTRYRLDIQVDSYFKSITIPTSNPSTSLVFDLYPPIIMDIEPNVKVDEQMQYAWINITVNATDGVNTKDLVLEYRIVKSSSSETIYRNVLYDKNFAGGYALFTIKHSIMLSYLKDEDVLIIEIILIDPTGKKTENTTYYRVWSRNESMNTVGGGAVNTGLQQSSNGGSGSISVNTPVFGDISVGGEGYFDIPQEKKAVDFNGLLYLTGIIISSLIIIGEIKRNRVEQ